jgi:voltage-gated potassium channel Kch
LRYLVIDFNPEVYKKLAAENEPVFFGDIADPEVLEAAQIGKAKLLISTIDNLNDNLLILEQISRSQKKPLGIFTSSSRGNALKLYEAGASYVVVPDVVTGDHIRHLLRLYGTKSRRLAKIGQKHFNRLIFT